MKAIILTSQRSGSTFLKSCLNAHPMVRCYGELLIGGNLKPPFPFKGRRLPTKAYRYILSRAWNPTAIMDRYYARNAAPVTVFKAMYNHADNKRVRTYLLEHPEIRVIHLRRDNLLKQYVSKLLLTSRQEKSWIPHTTEPVAVVATRVSPERAIKEMRRVENAYASFEQLLSGHRKVGLLYENLFSGDTLSSDAWTKISELLEIEPATASSDLIKMNPNNLRQIIDNYDEVAATLAGTKWERFLD